MKGKDVGKKEKKLGKSRRKKTLNHCNISTGGYMPTEKKTRKREKRIAYKKHKLKFMKTTITAILYYVFFKLLQSARPMSVLYAVAVSDRPRPTRKGSETEVKEREEYYATGKKKN